MNYNQVKPCTRVKWNRSFVPFEDLEATKNDWADIDNGARCCKVFDSDGDGTVDFGEFWKAPNFEAHDSTKTGTMVKWPASFHHWPCICEQNRNTTIYIIYTCSCSLMIFDDLWCVSSRILCEALVTTWFPLVSGTHRPRSVVNAGGLGMPRFKGECTDAWDHVEDFAGFCDIFPEISGGDSWFFSIAAFAASRITDHDSNRWDLLAIGDKQQVRSAVGSTRCDNGQDKMWYPRIKKVNEIFPLMFETFSDLFKGILRD